MFAAPLTCASTILGPASGTIDGVVLAAVIALISAFCFALAAVGQHHAASTADTKESFNPRLFLDLARNPMWWASAFGDMFGFILQAVALGLGAVGLVQPLLVTGLLLAIPISAAVDKRKVQRAEIYGALLCCAGLAAFLIAAQPAEGTEKLNGHDGFLLAVTVLPVSIVLLIGSLRFKGLAKAVALALCAGTLFGVCSPLISVIVRDLSHPFGWPLAVVAVAGIGGFLLTQNAYQAGSLPAPLAVLTIVEPLVAVALGVALLHENLEASPVAVTVIVASVIAVIVGVAIVARHAPDAQRAAVETETAAATA
jgi:drug/metabolite transporter (DMT)-like permease